MEGPRSDLPVWIQAATAAAEAELTDALELDGYIVEWDDTPLIPEDPE